MRLRKEAFFYEDRVLKTTWKLRIGICSVLILFLLLTGRYWMIAIGHSLVYQDELARSDIILIVDFDFDYLLFEAAAELQSKDFAPRVLVTGWTRGNRPSPDAWVRQIIHVISSAARVQNLEIIGVREIEPITFNVAKQVGDALRSEDVRSMIVVSQAFRSKRTSDIYRKVFEPLGVQIYCSPVFGMSRPED